MGILRPATMKHAKEITKRIAKSQLQQTKQTDFWKFAKLCFLSAILASIASAFYVAQL